MSRHTRKELAGFNGGEECFVYARQRADPDGPAFFLANEPFTEADRAWMKSELECPMPGCADRRIHPVNRSASGRRVGFSHHEGAGGHATESVDHHQSKLMIARWALTAHPGCAAVIEQTTDDLSRRADVMITFPDGRQLAVEVQYAGLTLSQWEERHDSYQRQGIACVWLLGHRPPHLQPSRGSGADVGLTALQTTMVEHGVPLLWVHPDGWIGTVTVNELGINVVPTNDPRQRCQFTADPLDDCTLTETGITTPTLTAAVAAQPELDALKARLAAEAAAEQARWLAQRQADAASRASRAEYAQKKRAEQHEQWLASDLRQQVAGRYDGVIPDPISVTEAQDSGVSADPEMWHAIICRDLIHGKIGTQFTVADVYRALWKAGIELHSDKCKRGTAIIGYLDALRLLGLLEVTHDPDRNYLIQTCTVVKDVDTYQQERVAADLQDARAREAAAELDASQPPPAQMTRTQEYFACRTCGRALDPVLKASGRHVLC